MEIRCQINFIKLCLWKFHELETLGTRQRTLQEKFEECSCARRHPVAFWILSIHLSANFFSRQPLSRELLREKIQGNVWKFQITTGRFLAQLHRSNFVVKILFLVPTVSDSRIFQKQSFMKIIWHRISIRKLYFKTRLPTRQDGFQNRDKVYRAHWIELMNLSSLHDNMKSQQRLCICEQSKFHGAHGACF